MFILYNKLIGISYRKNKSENRCINMLIATLFVILKTGNIPNIHEEINSNMSITWDIMYHLKISKDHY